MRASPQITRIYRPDPEASEKAVRLLLERDAKKAAHPGGPDDVRKDQNAHTATRSIPA
jgi:hypothetical protein